MFSNQVLDHFQNPRNAGELLNATHTVEVTNPVCGDVLKLSAQIENNKILEIRFLCRGCTTAIAAASFLTTILNGHTINEAGQITPEFLSESLGKLPAATFHGAQLAHDAVQKLLARLG